ncbi:MAG: hypothetical protein BGO32_07520 [Bacteroidetes bacterium 37-13]|nr:MAG: hypothetical protein BGO32_07520 [Bacteroidetes bacterium 37-13]
MPTPQTTYRSLISPLWAGFLAFIILFSLTGTVTYKMFQRYNATKKRELENAAALAKERIISVLEQNESAAKTLTLLIQKYGNADSFNLVAREIYNANEYVDIIEIVRESKITHVYPLAGNENIIGRKVLTDSIRYKALFEALRNGETYFTGPFELIQGGKAIIGRVPIYINHKYWGIAASITCLSTLVKAAKLENDNNYQFQLSKHDIVSNKLLFYLPNFKNFNLKNAISLSIATGGWKIYAAPKRAGTIETPFPFAILSFLFSLIAAVFVWSLSRKQYQLTNLVHLRTRELSESEMRHRKSLERIDDAFMAFDKEWNYTFMNKRAAADLGGEPNDFIGKNILESFKNIANEPFYELMQEGMRTNRPQTKELYFADRNKWFENTLYPSAEGYTIYYRDVTETKQMREAIAQERFLLDSIVKNMPGIFFILSREGKFIRWNKNAEIISGYENIDEMNPLDFFADADKPAVAKALVDIFKLGRSSEEVQLLTKDGTKIPYYFIGFTLKLNQEELIIGLGLDISSRIAAEQKANEFNERFELVTQATNDIIYDWKIDKEVIWWNQNFYNQLEIGSTAEWLNISTWIDNISEKDKERTLSSLQKAIKQKETYWAEEYRMTATSGKEIFVLDRGFLQYNSNEEAIRMIGAILDISEVKKAEEELINSQESLRKLAEHLQSVREDERAEVAREIHDELGQQLAALKMDVHWLEKKITNQDENTKNHIQEILSNIDDTVKIVRKIASSLRPGILDDLGLVAALEWLTIDFQKRTGITSVFTCNIETAKVAHNISIVLFRVFQESLTNIIRHANATFVKAELTIEPTQITLTISDNGKGFNTAKVNQKNTLGILGMKERVLALNGIFLIESNINAGTTISVKIIL